MHTTKASPIAPRTTKHYRLVQEQTAVHFRTRHVLGLLGVTGSVQLLEGSALMDLDEDTLIAVEAVLDMRTFASGSTARDRVVATPRFLDSSTHPRATYRSTRVERRDGGWLVHGELTVKGIPVPLDLDVAHPQEVDGAGGIERVLATADVDRTRYPISVPAALAARRLQIIVDACVTPIPNP